MEGKGPIVIPDEKLVEDGSSLANKESQALANNEDLQAKEEKNQSKRREDLRDIISKSACWWVLISAIFLICTTAIWFWHILSPEYYRWLTPSDITFIKESLTNIVIGTVVGFLARGRFM